METPASVRLTVRPLDWATSIDLADAYFHILIHPSFRKWLRFSHRSQVYQFRALPFGLSLAPWVFTRVIRDFVAALRLQGLRLSAYLDDWLLLASSRALCHQQTQHALQLALSLGFLPNFPKSELLPSQTFTFLGMFFQTVPYSVRPSSERLDRLRSLLDSFQGTHASARRLAALLGVMESLALLLPLGRLHKRQFQREFRRRWSQISAAWDARVPLLPWFHASVLQWQNTRWLLQGVPLTLPAPEATLFTDASHQGWGAHVEDLTSAGSWSPSLQSSHINMLELLAVHHAVLAFDAVLSGKHVLLCTDNTTVACYVNKQGGARSASLSRATEDLLLHCQSRSITLSARHVPGVLNIVADALSRPHSVLPTEWTLSHRVLRPLWLWWFRPMIDLFATQFNHRLPIYVSPVPDPRSWAIDSLTLPWTGLLAYAFPPFPILGKVLRKARADLPRMILIAPLWPAQPWFPDLLELSHVAPVPLEIGPRDLVQPRSGIPHGNPAMLHLHAWLLCGPRCEH